MITGSNFADDLCEAIQAKKSILCCGLDPQLRYMPPHLIGQAVDKYGRSFEALGWLWREFNFRIIDAVRKYVVCIKPQMAFYETIGQSGVAAFQDTVNYARKAGLLVIGDLKRNDGGDTADAYADGYLGDVPFFGFGDKLSDLTREESPIRVDCMTITPYIGEDCVVRFVQRVKEIGTGLFVVTKTSFKPNSVVEQLIVQDLGLPVWQAVAQMVQEWGEGTEGNYGLRNVGVVMGATYPEDAHRMRSILPSSFFLVPGFGAQGGDADDAVIGVREDGFGAVINTSRGLTYAWCGKDAKYRCESREFVDAAKQKAMDDRDALAQACKRAGKWSF